MASGAEPFYLNPTFWVAGSFTVFVGGVLYKKAHHAILAMLDDRIASVKSQMEAAKSLREEAEELLLDYQRRQREAEKEAAAMMARASDDAENLLAESKKEIEALIQRRTDAATAKIAQAEATATKEVKAAAVQVAVAAATDVMSSSLSAKTSKALVEKSIKDIGDSLH